MSAVIVVGSVNVDFVMRVPRLPSPGRTVTGGSLVRGPGGKGANQATVAARLGARVRIIGMVGDDPAGLEMRAELEQEGVDTANLGRSGGPTGTAIVLVDEVGENMIAVDPGANRALRSAFVEAALGGIDEREAVVVANLEIPDDAVLTAARAARARGWSFVLDPAPARHLDGELLPFIDVMTPNEHEAAALGASVDGLLAGGVGAVVVTEGARGARILRAGRPTVRQQAFAVDVVDTTGAGDAFTAALAWSLGRGDDLEGAVRIAAAAGALATRGPGARGGAPTRDEVESLTGAAAASGHRAT